MTNMTVPMRVATAADTAQITEVINAAFRIVEGFFIASERITEAEVAESLGEAERLRLRRDARDAFVSRAVVSRSGLPAKRTWIVVDAGSRAVLPRARLAIHGHSDRQPARRLAAVL